MEEKNVPKLILRHPQLLEYSIERTMQPRVDYLISLGVCKTNLGRMITLVPTLLEYRIEECLKPRVKYLQVRNHRYQQFLVFQYLCFVFIWSGTHGCELNLNGNCDFRTLWAFQRAIFLLSCRETLKFLLKASRTLLNQSCISCSLLELTWKTLLAWLQGKQISSRFNVSA